MGSFVLRKKRSDSFTIRSFQALRSQISSSSSSVLVPPMLVYKRFAVSVCFFFFLSVILVGRAQEDQILTNCPGNGANYTSGSQYETNLKALLRSLALNATRNIDTYYNTSIGSEPNRIYGYAQCMSAATASTCSACLNKSVTDLLGPRCPEKKTATIRYYSCIMRYSDRRFFSENDGSLIVYINNPGTATQATHFNAQLSSLLKNLSDKAASNSSRLAWGRTTYNEFSSIYGLAQCTRDLSPNDCSSCLEGTTSLIPTCCENKIGGSVYWPTCNIRFESSPFDPASRLPPPPPPVGVAAPPPPPNTGSTGGTNKRRRTVIIVVICAVSVALAAGVITILSICLSRRKKRWKKMPDPTNRAQLDWDARYKIIGGIARGLLYLHEDSRLRIIHRDLKASNILLDNDMSAKITDFGLAKLFGGDETQGNTSRIAGTYGYMAPEYAMQGHYSTKSDVFSFGVLVLEIVTGRKNSGFSASEPSIDLLSYTWRHWNEGRILDLMNQSLGEDYRRDEVIRCIHLGLLCVQEDPADRPLMSAVVLMLSSYSVTLPAPSPPAFFVGRSGMSQDNHSRGPDMVSSEWSRSTQKTTPTSINEVTISELDPR
ncbi:cysteine-rich receptor-like protein kinase 10 isoform X2 [Aristolochia californica]|uniref:cysteine-rich receptor-like protein kinase 10 isoform X2 n=1 Tax=Aristolochia californica TaxID=171875 RepID=UPI0035E165CD